MTKKTDEETYDEIVHEIQNKLYLEYLRRNSWNWFLTSVLALFLAAIVCFTGKAWGVFP